MAKPLVPAIPAPPPIPQPPPIPPEPQSLWNPVHLGLLGIVFTPAWAGVMAAINGHRLGFDVLWRPIAVGTLAILLYFVLPWILAVGVYCGALVLIWKLDLKPQLEASSGSTSSSSFDLLIPCVAGIPLALCAFIGFFVFPFLGASGQPSMARNFTSTQVNTRQPSRAFDLSEMLARTKKQNEDRDRATYFRWGAVGLAKLFGGAGGKAFGLLLVGLGVGVLKWFTRKPTESIDA